MKFNYKKKLKQFKKIFVLVSGGIDSTYLYDKIKEIFPKKTYPVNCFNPYEQSETLDKIAKDPNYIQITPGKDINYKKLLKKAFLNLPKAYELKRRGRYAKKVFGCCYYIKHKAFLKDPLFQEDKTVVISGIKAGDGTQRALWLSDLREGKRDLGTGEKNNYYYLKEGKAKPTFFHKHKSGQLYCYPFRDYTKRELPNKIIKRLREKYPNLDIRGVIYVLF
jgi:3'-phosphoadenosine 5'-phosphosulfate sulfotransferase (PAPS reductase)/FAD synthetase